MIEMYETSNSSNLSVVSYIVVDVFAIGSISAESDDNVRLAMHLYISQLPGKIFYK